MIERSLGTFIVGILLAIFLKDIRVFIVMTLLSLILFIYFIIINYKKIQEGLKR